MSSNDYDVVTGGPPAKGGSPGRTSERRRSVYDIIQEHRQRLTDTQARRDAAQARRDAARDRLWGRPAFTILPREE